ncbi:MAG: hypothetical protein Q6373_015800, partial [Candidatus Sigynarchaeota archaeon]
GLIIEYPLARAFVERWLGKFASLTAAAREADARHGPGSDVPVSMLFFKDGRKIRQLRPERDSGTRFIILSLKLGNFIDLGFPDNTIHSDVAFIKEKKDLDVIYTFKGRLASSLHINETHIYALTTEVDPPDNRPKPVRFKEKIGWTWKDKS